LEGQLGQLRAQPSQPLEGVPVLRAQVLVDGPGDVGTLLHRSALDEQGRAQGQASDAGIFRMGAQQRVEPLLVGAEELEEARHVLLGEAEGLLAQA
jgi:hypothetical protein